MEKMLNKFIDNLKETFDERLLSVFLYGSCATGECDNSFSDVNLIVIIKDLKAQDLKLANKFVTKIVKKSKTLPIFMDSEEWFNSCDVYAIECSDIKDRNKILYGKDLISDLNIDKKDLRFQCEQETKNLLIRLRQSYLSKTTDKNELKKIVRMSSKPFIVIFRTILKLIDEQVPKSHSDVVKSFAKKIHEHEIEFDTDMFLKILHFRETPKIINDAELETIVQKLIDTSNSVLKYVDRL